MPIFQRARMNAHRLKADESRLKSNRLYWLYRASQPTASRERTMKTFDLYGFYTLKALTSILTFALLIGCGAVETSAPGPTNTGDQSTQDSTDNQDAGEDSSSSGSDSTTPAPESNDDTSTEDEVETTPEEGETDPTSDQVEVEEEVDEVIEEAEVEDGPELEEPISDFEGCDRIGFTPLQEIAEIEALTGESLGIAPEDLEVTEQ